MARRRLDDFLSSYVKFTDNTESPSNYHLWAGIAVIASALQRRVHMVWGHTIIYPNQYIVLIGPSGIRKAEPVVIANAFLRRLETIRLVPEVSTRQALVRYMRNAVSSYTTGGTPINQCAVTGVFEELSVFLGEGDNQFLSWLTNWYDSRDRWVYDTKNAGTDEVVGVCMTMFGSTAPDWIPLIIPFTAIGGGFTSRIIFIVEHKKGKIIENPNEVYIDTKLQEDLDADLEMISQITGAYTMHPMALEEYMEWYREGEEATASGAPAIRDPRFGGYVSRRATHVKKLAMCCAAARDNSMLVLLEDFHRALAMMEKAEEAMQNVFSSIGRSQYAAPMDSVMDFIKARGTVRKSELLRLLYYDLDIRTLDIIEESLVAMQVIKKTVDAPTADVEYKWVGNPDSFKN